MRLPYPGSPFLQRRAFPMDPAILAQSICLSQILVPLLVPGMHPPGRLRTDLLDKEEKQTAYSRFPSVYDLYIISTISVLQFDYTVTTLGHHLEATAPVRTGEVPVGSPEQTRIHS